MDTERTETVPHSGDLERHPTTREIVEAALADSAALAVKPTGMCPNYAIPCEDMDGSPHRLVVVALGGRVALADLSSGTAAVLDGNSVGALLAGGIEDRLAVEVHGGEVRTGEVKIDAKIEVFDREQANVSVTARPYAKEIELNFEFMDARLTYWPTLAQIRKLKQMLADAETIMLGWHKKTPKPKMTPPRRRDSKKWAVSIQSVCAVFPPRHDVVPDEGAGRLVVGMLGQVGRVRWYPGPWTPRPHH